MKKIITLAAIVCNPPIVSNNSHIYYFSSSLASITNELRTIEPQIPVEDLLNALGTSAQIVYTPIDNLYQIRVITQKNNECFFHQVRNLFYFMNLCQQSLATQIKEQYQQLLNENLYESFVKKALTVHKLKRGEAAEFLLTKDKVEQLIPSIPQDSTVLFSQITSLDFYKGKNIDLNITASLNLETKCIQEISKNMKNIELNFNPNPLLANEGSILVSGLDIKKLYQLASQLHTNENGLIGIQLGIYFGMPHAVSLVFYKYKNELTIFLLDSLNKNYTTIIPGKEGITENYNNYKSSLDIIGDFIRNPTHILDAYIRYQYWNEVDEKNENAFDDVIAWPETQKNPLYKIYEKEIGKYRKK